jgi:hypothetical protein
MWRSATMDQSRALQEVDAMVLQTTRAQRRARRAIRHSGERRCWQFTTPAPEELRVAFLRSILTYDDVRPLFDWLVCCPNWRAISFDFSAVRDLAAPWAPVFAHLEYVASRTGIRCRLVGLNARLREMASFAMERSVAGKPEVVDEDTNQTCDVGKC